MTSVAVIDHGAGNLVSMMRALETVGADPTLVRSGALGEFDRVVLPGVGATGPAMRTLNQTGLSDELRNYRSPLLGVCVGMQLLFEYSTEDDTECLGLIRGDVRRMDASPLPHIGWNSVEQTSNAIFTGLGSSPLFYFVHSFAAHPSDPRLVAGRTSYGENVFVSAVESGSTTGLQFHPERSGAAGLRVLANFLDDSREVRDVA
ncbi:MAG: imidazole glycerol phosphate synthase subunit HisH [Acidimicrobiia bacterium]|nr:MAG: imidazole glycerol phosphate synthase subunit HisH [Acidimicrobiia bacterium]